MLNKTRLDRIEASLSKLTLGTRAGKVREVGSTLIRCSAPDVKVGEACFLSDMTTGAHVEVEVIGLDGEDALLTPIGSIEGLTKNALLLPTGMPASIGVGDGYLGMVLDGCGNPIDGSTPPDPEAWHPIVAPSPNSMTRPIIKKTFQVGVKAIDGMLTVGDGQRVGIFAAAGGGKSTLMSMLVRGAAADVVVTALIGERGREVREFVEEMLGAAGREKSVTFVATSDTPAMLQVRTAYAATTMAEYFRSKGKKVLFLMDSVTRFARAAREIGLAAGEPPARNGFPPSVFAKLPLLLERTGLSAEGSITAFYTVLVEGDDFNEPVADETRSLLDGHIVLSQELAASGHYPAIDVLRSKSRVMPMIVDKSHQKRVGRLLKLMAKYKEVELLVNIGEYAAGSDALADEAIQKRDQINDFLTQLTDEFFDLKDAWRQISNLAGETADAE